MRKVSYGGACSADNFITGADEAIDWIRMSDDVDAIMKESWRGVDTILMGRKTWEFAKRMGGGAVMSGMTTCIFSRTMSEAPKGAQLICDDAVGFVRTLKAKPGGGIIVMGGGELGTALIEGGVVDEIGLSIHPLLLGSGTPLFQSMRCRVELELIEARAIAKGCVLVRWRVVN